MSDSIYLRLDDRKTLLDHYRSSPISAVRLRCYIPLLLDVGHPWEFIGVVLLTSSATIDRLRRAYVWGGIHAMVTRPAPCEFGGGWVRTIIGWVLALAPSDFGFALSRWTREAVAIALREGHGVRMSQETVRRRLHGRGLVWRCFHSVVCGRDPERVAQVAASRRLLHGLPPDETAVLINEVEVHTNPKIGQMWMRWRQRATVETPVDNEKRVLTRSLHRRTGWLIETWWRQEEGRTTCLFCRHLDDLRRAFRHYKVIHAICDNTYTPRPDRSRVVREHLAAWGRRVRLH
jgi:hypothetical protein